jgi:hypothetical protein
MSDNPKSRPSFSPASRWRIGFDVALRTVLVVAVAVMANYLATRVYHRFHWSSQTQTALSSHTLSALRSLTNRVDVTLYYDRTADFYPDIVALLNEYRAANKNISVRTVDYLRDPGEAEIIKEKYQQHFMSSSDTNVVIFDCGGIVRVFPGDKLTTSKTTLTGWHARPDNPDQRVPEFERHVVSFNGEQAFTSILLALANPQPLKAFFLQGHGEVSLTDSGQRGFLKFAAVLQENSISVENLDWVGAGVPADCDLLVIAAPNQAFKEVELQQIAQYLREGGKLLMLFGYSAQGHPTGLETLLKTWGIGVADDVARDFKYSTTSQGYDMMLNQFGRHPVVDSLSQTLLQLYFPRPILNLNSGGQPANAPQVDVLFGTSAGGTLMIDRNAPPGHYPLACAVEQKPVAGVSNPRGSTRIVVVGDATFLGNVLIDSGGNRDFLNNAVNWLCDRPMLLSGVGPRPVTNFRLQITQHQQRQLTWLLLGVLPGVVLVLGWFVWLVRRK